jgi:hypothetical protein
MSINKINILFINYFNIFILGEEGHPSGYIPENDFP